MSSTATILQAVMKHLLNVYVPLMNIKYRDLSNMCMGGIRCDQS